MQRKSCMLTLMLPIVHPHCLRSFKSFSRLYLHLWTQPQGCWAVNPMDSSPNIYLFINDPHLVFCTVGKMESGRDTREQRKPLQHI